MQLRKFITARTKLIIFHETPKQNSWLIIHKSDRAETLPELCCGPETAEKDKFPTLLQRNTEILFRAERKSTATGKTKSKANWRKRTKFCALALPPGKRSSKCSKLKFKHVELSFAPKCRQQYLVQAIKNSMIFITKWLKAKTKLCSRELR